MRDHEVDLDQPNDHGQCLLHLLIQDEDTDKVEFVLNPPSDCKSKKADPNKVDGKLGWSPLVLAINQGPTGYEAGIYALLRAKADANMEVEGRTPI